MQYTINELYEEIFQKVYSIRDIFIGFFGEEYVDLQLLHDKYWYVDIIVDYLIRANISLNESDNLDTTKYEIPTNVYNNIIDSIKHNKHTIYVWWPEVTVTNEFEKSIKIQDLYAKIEVTIEGVIPFENIGFLLNRATYIASQFKSDYLHSHIQYIPKTNFQQFMSPCLGHGPIKNTINSLKTDYDEVSWMLFCQELSLYVTVESIVGGPWKRMENVGKSVRKYDYDKAGSMFESYYLTEDTYNLTKSFIKDFIKYYIENGHLIITYNATAYQLGMPYIDYIIDVSNSFIDYYNTILKKTGVTKEELFTNRVLSKVQIRDNIVYESLTESTHVADVYRDKLVLYFKGNAIRTRIIEEDALEDNISILLNATIISIILKNILKIINFKYCHGHAEPTSPVNKKGIYL